MGQTTNLRWRIAALLFLASVINYVDRQTLSVVAPYVSEELGLSNIDYSNVVLAFLLPYTLVYPLAGLWIDRVGTRASLAISMAWWSLANALHATAQSALSLGIFRFLLGTGESVNFLAAEKAISEWYPPTERGFANGLVNAAAASGAILSPPLVIWIYTLFGWRPAFVITGALGFVWMVGWLRLYYPPEKHPRISEGEFRWIRPFEGTAKAPRRDRGARPPWSSLLRYRQTWGLLIARFFADPVWWFYLFWLPKYLADERGFTPTEIGLVAWLPFLTADAGSILGGLFSGYLIRKKMAVLGARKWTMLPCVLVMPLGIIIAQTTSSVLAVGLICLVTFSHMAWKTNLMTMTNDIYPIRIVGSVAGIVGLGSGLGGAVFTNLTGYLVEYFSYKLVFVIMAFLHPLAMLTIWLMVRGPIEDDRSANEAAVEMEAPTRGAG